MVVDITLSYQAACLYRGGFVGVGVCRVRDGVADEGMTVV